MIIWIITAAVIVGYLVGRVEKYPFAKANDKKMVEIMNKIARGGK